MTYGYLGPAGTFCEAAIRSMAASEGTELVPLASVSIALDAVRDGEVDGAVVPIENSIEGSVSATLDELASGDPLAIVDEIAIPVRFSLVAPAGRTLADIRRISTHPHAHAQCRGWLRENLPGVSVIPNMSTAAAAEALTHDDPGFDAAICAGIAAQTYGLDVLAEGIGDNEEAWTRFVMVRRPGNTPAATGADKTTMVLFMRADHPGALLEILTEFSVRGVNLTRIESRPTKRALGDYCFSIDCEGHIDDSRVGEALMGLHRICADVRFLGSYARHDGKEPLLRPGVTDEDFSEASKWLAHLRSNESEQ